MSGLGLAERTAWTVVWRWEEGTNSKEEERATVAGAEGEREAVGGASSGRTSCWDLVFLSKEQWGVPSSVSSSANQASFQSLLGGVKPG